MAAGSDKFKKLFIVAHGPNQHNAPNLWLIRMLPRLREYGFESHVSFLMNSEEECQIVAELHQRGVSCTRFRNRNTEDSLIHLLEEVKEVRPDIYIPNLAVPAYFATPWVKEAGIPVIAMIRSDDDFYHDIVDYFVAGEERFRATAVVCVSEYLEGYVSKRVSDDCLTMACPSGAPVPEKKASVPRDTLRVAYFGRLVERQKRILDVVDAMGEIVKLIPEAQTTVYGDGLDKEKALLRIKSYESSRLVYGGFIREPDIQPVMAKEHVLLLLSEFEGLSTALLEGMATGLVPICFDFRSGLSEVITDGVNGFIVQDRKEAVVEAVRRLSSDPDLWQKMSENARSHVEKHFSSATCAKRWSDFCKAILKNTGERTEMRIPTLPEISLPQTGTRERGIRIEDKRKESASSS